MDDINVEANPDYLDITANIDKSGAEPVANVEIDLKKDVSTIKAKVSLSAEMGGVFKDIFVAKEFSPCDDDVEDEFVKYALWVENFFRQFKQLVVIKTFLHRESIEKFGNLQITCPMKAVIIIVVMLRQKQSPSSQILEQEFPKLFVSTQHNTNLRKSH